MQDAPYPVRPCEQCGGPLTGRQKRFCSKSCWGAWGGSRKRAYTPCRGCGERKPKDRACAVRNGRDLRGLCTECYRARLLRPDYGHGRPVLAGNGYLHRWNPTHPESSGGLVLVHREVWHDANGPIPEGHHIHHRNGDKLDNRLENLELVSAAEHSRRHVAERGYVENQYGRWPLKTKP